MNTQRAKDEKTILSLERDRTALLNMRADIQVYLAREEPWETALRVMLIREREAQCGRGRLQYCDYFSSSFYDGQELMDVGYHPKYRNPRKRFKYQHTEEELRSNSSSNRSLHNDDDDEHYYHYQLYADGAVCNKEGDNPSSSIRRATIVHFVCGTYNTIINVTESQVTLIDGLKNRVIHI
jgi:hypothetical protein